MPCGLYAPCGLALFYENRKKAESKREGLWTFIKWPTRLQTCQLEAQNWVSCLMWALQMCADSWPSVNNAAVSRTWPESPHTLSFPWAWDESTQDVASALFIKIFICSSKETLNYLSIPLDCCAFMASDRKFTFQCSLTFSCICNFIMLWLHQW